MAVLMGAWHVIAPPYLMWMGVNAARRLRREGATMRWFTRVVYRFDAVTMPIMGMFLLVAWVWELIW